MVPSYRSFLLLFYSVGSRAHTNTFFRPISWKTEIEHKRKVCLKTFMFSFPVLVGWFLTYVSDWTYFSSYFYPFECMLFAPFSRPRENILHLQRPTKYLAKSRTTLKKVVPHCLKRPWVIHTSTSYHLSYLTCTIEWSNEIIMIPFDVTFYSWQFPIEGKLRPNSHVGVGISYWGEIGILGIFKFTPFDYSHQLPSNRQL